MARGEIIDDVDYVDITDMGPDEGTMPDKPVNPAHLPLSKRPPPAQFRILKNNILADLDASHKWREGATDDLGFAAGDQLSEEDKQLLDEQGRPHIVFNRVETILKAISGMEINGRHEITFLPRNNADTEKNEVLSAGSKWMGDGCDAEDEQSLGFQDALTTGMGWVECRYSFEDEPEGQYIEEQIDCREMTWDRTARKKNLRDARRMARLRRMPLQDAMEMFPGKTKLQIDAVWANNTYLDNKTLKSIEEKRIRDGNDSEDEFDDRNEVTVVVVQWREKQIYYRVADTATNTIKEYSEEEHAKMVARLRMIGERAGATPRLHSRRATRWAYFQAFLGSETLLDKVEQAPCGKQFSWACITGSFDAKKRMWYGMVRAMRDPQLWANKFMSQIMQIMNATAKGGIIAETDAFEDQRDAEETYAMPESITWVAPNALSGQKPKIMPKPGQGDASAYVKLLEYAISSITAVTGVNLELLGQAEKDQPGIIERMRKQAGMTVLATMFDSLRGFMKLVGRKRLYFLQTRVPDGTLIRVVGDEYTQVVPWAKDRATGTFDVIVDDAPTSPNQKEAAWAIMQPMLVAFKDELAANPEVLIMALEYSPLPSPFVNALKRIMLQAKNDPEAQAQAQAMQQAALQQILAEIDKDRAQAELHRAKAGTAGSEAAYDLAMAQNLLAKNDVEGFNHHIQAMAEAAKAENYKAQAAKTHVQAQREAVALRGDMQGMQLSGEQHESDMQDAAIGRRVDVFKAVTDRMKAHIQGRQVEHGALRDRVAAHQNARSQDHTEQMDHRSAARDDFSAVHGAASETRKQEHAEHSDRRSQDRDDAQLGHTVQHDRAKLQHDERALDQKAEVEHQKAAIDRISAMAGAHKDFAGAIASLRPPAPRAR